MSKEDLGLIRLCSSLIFGAEMDVLQPKIKVWSLSRSLKGERREEGNTPNFRLE